MAVLLLTVATLLASVLGEVAVIDEAGAAQHLVAESKLRKSIGTKEIEAVVAKIARIPPKNVSKDDVVVLKDLESSLKRVVFGQDDAIVALCAEAVGAMETLYKDTVAYTQEREQFDHPLSDFQVLQHRMVEMFMEYEQCKSLLFRATMELASGDSVEAQRAVHAVKHMIGKAGTFIGENAVQLHGGMGMTEECSVAHYAKRLIFIDHELGDRDYHLDTVIARLDTAA